MNHTGRIAETAHRHRNLTRRIAKEAIETYLELLAGEIATGEWVEIHTIGKMQVIIEEGSGAKALSGYQRIRTKLRLGDTFKSATTASLKNVPKVTKK